MAEALCECPKCGRMHRDLQAGGLPPTAWMRRLRTPSTPHGPSEMVDEVVPGDDRPEGDGWFPLYRERP